MAKSLFIRCYGRLTPDMMVGGLLDMGVPVPYVEEALSQAGRTEKAITASPSKAQIKAGYFHLPPLPRTELLLKERPMLAFWNALCDKGCQEYRNGGWKVISAFSAGEAEVLDLPADIVDFYRGGAGEENLLSLYAFLACLDYLSVETVFTCPFEVGEAKTEKEKITAAILRRSGSTEGLPVPPAGIEPFAAAMLEGLSSDFTPMDGRFLLETTSYGTDSSTSPDGDNTAAFYLGYFTEQRESIFRKQLKTFGVGIDSDR